MKNLLSINELRFYKLSCKALLMNRLSLAIIGVLYSQAYATPVDLSSQQNFDHSRDMPQFAPIVITVSAQPQQSMSHLHADPRQAIQPIPASDGATYLKTLMGFNAVQSGGTNGDVTFRGMFGSRIKILVDGAENLGACPNRMDAPTSYIAPQSFERIDVVKGPQTVLYPMGSAATVNFERAIPRHLDQQPVQGQIDSVFGSFGRIDQNLNMTLGNRLGYARLNAGRSQSDSYQDGLGITVPSAWQKWNVDAALGWTPSTSRVVELHGGTSDGNAVYGGRMMDGSQFKRQSIGLLAQQQFDHSVLKNVQARIDYSDNDHVMDNFSLRPFQPTMMMAMPMAMNVTRQTLNARLKADYQIGAVTAQSGIDMQHNSHSGRMGMNNSYLNQPYNPDARDRNYGAFSEFNLSLHPTTQLVAGARVDDTHIEDLRTASAQSGLNTTRHHTAIGGFARLENNTSQTSWLAGLGFVERMPDYWELFTPVHGNSGSSNSFNGVNPEKTAQIDVAYRFKKGALQTNIAAYYGIINDFILINYHHHGGDMTGMISPSASNVDATIAGAEAGIGYRFDQHLSVDANLAYAWGKNTTHQLPLPQIAPLEGRLNVKYAVNDYSIGALLRMVAAQNRIASYQGNIVGFDMAPSVGFSTLSLNGSYQLNQHLNWSVGIDNVLNKTYSEHLNKAGSGDFGYAQEQQFNNSGRNYWTKFTVHY